MRLRFFPYAYSLFFLLTIPLSSNMFLERNFEKHSHPLIDSSSPLKLIPIDYDFDPNQEYNPKIDHPPLEDLNLSSDLIDLEQNPDSFVLEVKKIEIEGYPGSFNPSILRWNDSFVFSFRIRDPQNNSTFQIGLALMDEEFNPISKTYIVDMRLPARRLPSELQDPRLISFQNRLFIVYSNTLDQLNEKKLRRVHLAEIKWDGQAFYVDEAECIEKYPGENKLRWEKNWVPFIYNDELLLGYSLVPHHIFRPLWGTGRCETVSSSLGLIKWPYGVLRGGTQAHLVDGQYLSFFHSSITMATVQSLGKMMPHYFMGAYTFSAEPPFAITRISKEPIIGRNFYNGFIHKTWKPLRVVFPGGFVFDDQYIWVVYGRQDHELWVAKLDKKGLINSLTPVYSIK